MTVTRFEDLEVWKIARELAKEVYELFTHSPDFSKDFQLKAQINGSVGSIMDNIAEGFERGSRNEFINFLSFAKGSAGEVKSQLYRAVDRDYVTRVKFNELYHKASTIAKKLNSLIVYLNTTEHKGTKFKNRQHN